MSPDDRDPRPDPGVRQTEVTEQVTLSFAGADGEIFGTVRGLSNLGTVFVARSRLTLPRHVTLAFGNGESFECAVEHGHDGTEFALTFLDAGALDKSAIRRCMDRVRDFRDSHSPAPIGDRLEELSFFGDDELLDLMERCLDSYDEFVRICSERLLPH